MWRRPSAHALSGTSCSTYPPSSSESATACANDRRSTSHWRMSSKSTARGDVSAVGGGEVDLLHLAGSGGHGDGECVSRGEVGRTVRDGKGEVRGESHSDSGNAEEYPVGVLDGEFADVGGGFDADDLVNARLCGLA